MNKLEDFRRNDRFSIT